MLSAVYLIHSSAWGIFIDGGRPAWAQFKSSRTGLLGHTEWQ